jgi:hypothetical protein
MRLSRLATPLLLIMLAGPVASDVWDYGESDCKELWFMRNLIMDRAGYCFGTTLGKAVYDNADCVGKDVSLTRPQSDQVARIQKLEREIGCKVNTGSRTLEVKTMASLRRLRDMPLPDNGGSACTYTGARLPLHDGYSAGSAVIAQVDAGDRLYFGWIGTGDWYVISAEKGGNGGTSVLGWIDRRTVNFEKACTNWAG